MTKKIIKPAKYLDHLFKNAGFRYKIMKIARIFGLGGFLWRLYCKIFGPGGGILLLNVAGKSVKFFVHNQEFANSLKSMWEEDHLLRKMMDELLPGDCAYDVGAEIGLYTLFLAQAVGEKGQIVAFEPEQNRYHRLQENLKLNGVKNIKVLSMALGDITGKGELLVGRYGAAPGLIDVPGLKANSISKQLVNVIEGDRVVEMFTFPIPKAVKIDVEGFEYSVIKGLQETFKHPNCRMVCCEVHPFMLPEGITPNDVTDLLGSFGFIYIDKFPRGETFHALCYKNPPTR